MQKNIKPLHANNLYVKLMSIMHAEKQTLCNTKLLVNNASVLHSYVLLYNKGILNYNRH